MEMPQPSTATWCLVTGQPHDDNSACGSLALPADLHWEKLTGWDLPGKS